MEKTVESQVKAILTRLFLQTGLGVTWGYMFAMAYNAGDRIGMGLMVAGIVVTFWAFTR